VARDMSQGAQLYRTALWKTVSIKLASGTAFSIGVSAVFGLSGDVRSALLSTSCKAPSISMHLQHIPRHQLEGNEFNSLRRWRCLVRADSFKVTCLSHQFDGEARHGPCRREIWIGDPHAEVRESDRGECDRSGC
jgi:hypothetical protein